MEANIQLRTATEADAESILKIYAPYVKNTAITYEYEVPSTEDFEKRIRKILASYPYIVAELDSEIVGYAYAGPFKERAAYDWSVETTIYISLNHKHMGIGRMLYEALEQALSNMGITNVNACIAYPDKEDEYLTGDSVAFHEKMGYAMVGEFHKCAYKFNRWYNMVWMEKMIGKHIANQPPVVLSKHSGEQATIVVYKDDTQYFIPFDEILFFESDESLPGAQSVAAHTATEVYGSDYKLYELEKILPQEFLRVSKSTIANVSKVLSVKRNVTASSLVAFADSYKQIYVSRSYFKAFRERLNRILGI